MYLYAEKILVVDLGTGETTVKEFSDELAEEVIGGVGLAAHLLEEHAAGDPVVLSTGPLTGTLVPGAALAVLSRLAPDGAPLHSPLTLFVGSELKYSGFDAVVVRGAAASPTYLWLHDGMASLEDAADLWGCDTWAAADAIKAAKGDQVIQVLGIGSAGERGLPGAQVTANYWSTADHAGFGAAFGAKNLKAVAMRGLGLLDAEEPEELFEASTELGARLAAAGPPLGSAAAAAAAGAAEGIGEWLAPLVHRHRGCFACPSACFTFLKYNESPSEMASTSVAEPGLLLTDVRAAAALRAAGWTVEEAARLLEAAARRGVDPAVAARLAVDAGSPTAAAGAELLDSADADLLAPAAEAALAGVDAADERGRAGYVFGVCPTLLTVAPDLEVEALTEALRLGSGMEIDGDDAARAAASAGPALPAGIV